MLNCAASFDYLLADSSLGGSGLSWSILPTQLPE